MAARRGLELVEQHRRRVEAGEVTIAGLADELGCSRQSVHEAFRRRSWPTKATLAENRLGVDPHAPGGQERPGGGQPPGAPTSATGRRLAPAAPSPLPPSPSSASAAPQAPAVSIYWTDRGDLASLIEHEAMNTSILLLTRARDALASGQPMSMNALKAAASASSLALEQLRALGLVKDPDLAGPQQLVIMEMTANEVAEAQRQAEAEHHGVVNDTDD